MTGHLYPPQTIVLNAGTYYETHAAGGYGPCVYCGKRPPQGMSAWVDDTPCPSPSPISLLSTEQGGER